MQGDRFFLEIQGNKVRINEPWDFSNVDFTIKQDKEYFYRDLAFGGNKAELMFVKSRHDNVLELLFQEAKTNGSNSEVYFYYNDDIRLRLDFGTYESNYYDYFKCQAIKDTVLDILNDNKSVKVDLLSDKDIFENNAPKLELKRTYASAMGIYRESNWKNDKEVRIGTGTNRALLCINTISKINRSDIKNTYVAPQDYTRRDWDSWWVRKQYQFISFRDNYKSVNVYVNINMLFYSNDNLSQDATLTMFIGREDLENKEWYDSCQKIHIATVNKNKGNRNVNVEQSYNFNNIPRGYGIWIVWECRLPPLSSTLTDVYVTDYGSEVNVKGISFAFGSVISTNTYKDCIDNLIKKIVPNADCRFDINTYLQADNLLFSGNQIRFGEDKPFILTWKDVVEQLKEFGLGYRLEGNTVVFDKIESFYKDELVHHFDNVNSYDDFKITEDDTYNVNIFEYGYKKYQALKENAIEGNAGTINGESQWYVKNKFTENSLKIDLPISRDKFLLEDTRVQSLAYNKNTSKQDDNTLYLFSKNIGSVFVNETAFLRATFQEDSGMQSFSVRESEFSWLKIGVRYSTFITFVLNGIDRMYVVVEVSDNTILCSRVNHTQVANIDAQFNFKFDSETSYNINVSNANDSKSIRQNLSYMGAYLNPYNYYTNSPVTNREYKEDANFTLNGITETDPIYFYEPFKLTPKVVEFKTTDRFDVYKIIEKNINGYCTVNNLKGELIQFYIKELNLRVLECGNAEYEIKGQVYDTVL